MEQQQKFEERQKKLVMELHKQQLEFQQFTQQITELEQKYFEELLVNSLHGSKISEKDTIYSHSAIYNSTDTFEYVPENDKTFEAFYKRYEDIFCVDCEQWPSKRKIPLLLRKMGTTEHYRFVDFILPKKTTDLDFLETIKFLSKLFGPNTTLFHKRWKCLYTVKDYQQDFPTFAASVNKLCNDFKLAELTADDLKCLIFAQDLVSAEDTVVRWRVLTKLEKELGLTLQKLAGDCQRAISVKCDSTTIEESGVAQIRKIKSKSTAYSRQKDKKQISCSKPRDKQNANRLKKPPGSCYHCAKWHWIKFCPVKKKKY